MHGCVSCRKFPMNPGQFFGQIASFRQIDGKSKACFLFASQVSDRSMAVFRQVTTFRQKELVSDENDYFQKTKNWLNQFHGKELV